MRRMKRVLSLLLALCMIFAMAPSFAMAEGETTNEASFWTGETADAVVECATLKEALEMLNKDGRTRTGKEVITLLKDVSVGARTFTDGASGSAAFAFEVEKGGYTLDLGGHTLTSSTGVFRIYYGGSTFDKTDARYTMTIKNGTLYSSVSNKIGINHYKMALVLENLDILTSGTALITYNSDATVDITIKDSNIVSSAASASAIQTGNYGTIHIASSNFVTASTSYALHFKDQNGVGTASAIVFDDANVTVSYKSKFAHAANLAAFSYASGVEGVDAITDGTGSYTFPGNVTYSASGLNTWKTQEEAGAPADTVASYTGANGEEEYFNTITGAFDAWIAAGKTGTIDLYQDVVLNSVKDTNSNAAIDPAVAHSTDTYALIDMTTGDDLTLNLNGYTLSRSDQCVFISKNSTTAAPQLVSIYKGAELTINGGVGTDGLPGEILWSGYNMIVVGASSLNDFSGKLELNDVKVVQQRIDCHVIYSRGTTGGGKYIMNGAVIVSPGYPINTSYTTDDSKGVWVFTGGTQVYAHTGTYGGLLPAGDTAILHDVEIKHYHNNSGTLTNRMILREKIGSAGTDALRNLDFCGSAAVLSTDYVANKYLETTGTNGGIGTETTYSGHENLYTIKVTPTAGNEVFTYPVTYKATETSAAVDCLSLDDAMTYVTANKGGIVTLNRDIISTSTAGYLIDTSVGFTLDLNGHTIKALNHIIRAYNTTTSDIYNTYSDAQKTLVVKNGTMIADSDSNGTNFLVNNYRGYLQMENVKGRATGQAISFSSIDAETETCKNIIRNCEIIGEKWYPIVYNRDTSSATQTGINITVEGSTLVSYTDAAVGSLQSGNTVTFKGANELYTEADAGAVQSTVAASYELPLGAAVSGQTYTFSADSAYTASNLDRYKSTYSGGFTYTTKTGETYGPYAVLNEKNDSDPSNINSAFEAMTAYGVGGTITMYEPIYFGNPSNYEDGKKLVSLPNGGQKEVKVSSFFLDGGKTFLDNFDTSVGKEFTLDMNGMSITMGSDGVHASNPQFVYQPTTDKVSNVTIKNGVIDWGGTRGPFYVSGANTILTLTLSNLKVSTKVNSDDYGFVLGINKITNADITIDNCEFVSNNNFAIRLWGSCDADIALKNGTVLVSKGYASAVNVSAGKADITISTDDVAVPGVTVYQTGNGSIAPNCTLNYTGLAQVGPTADSTYGSGMYKYEYEVTTTVASYIAPDGTEQEFDSLKAAFDASQAADAVPGGTIKLYQNITVDSFTTDTYKLTSSSGYVMSLDSSSKAFTLDLNGMTIALEEFVPSSSVNVGLASLNGSASLTVKNGSIDWTGTSSVFFASTSSVCDWSGSLILENVNAFHDCVGRIFNGYISTGDITVIGGSLASSNAPICLSASNVANMMHKATITLKDGAVIYGGYNTSVVGGNGVENVGIRINDTNLAAGSTMAPVINIENAVFYEYTNSRSSIVTTVTDAGNDYTSCVKLPLGAEFSVSASTTNKKFDYASSASGNHSTKDCNFYMHSVSISAVSYTTADGSKTTKYSSLKDAFTALNADRDNTSATKPGTITMLCDYVIDENEPKMYVSSSASGSAIICNVGGYFVWDLNGHTIKTADDYTLECYLMFNSVESRKFIGVIKNGKFDLTASQNVCLVGNSTTHPTNDVTFKYVDVDLTTTAGDRAFFASRSNNVTLTLDGGTFNVNNETGYAFVFTTLKKSATGDITSRFNLKGGVTLMKSGFHGYSTNLTNVKTKQIYIYDAAFTTYGSYPWSSKLILATGALIAPDGSELTPATAEEFVNDYFEKETVKPSIFTDGAYATQHYLLTYAPGFGSASQEADSVVKSETTGLYYNMDMLVRYLPKAEAGDVLTAVANIDGTDSSFYDATGMMPVLESTNAVTFELGSYTVNCNLTAGDGITISGGTVTGDITVNGGSLDLQTTNVLGEIMINVAGSHTVTGGTITASQPISLITGAVLTVSEGAVIDASTGAAAQGTGGIIFKTATVKFATGTEPFGTVTAEGAYSESEAGGVTTRTYTPAGDTEQGTNVAMLVENGTYFATMEDAMMAASALTAETVKLLADTNEGAVTVNKTVAIDLNGKTAVAEITITGGSVTIENGTVATANGDAITVTGGTVTLSGVTAEATGNAVNVNGASADVTVKNSALTGATAGGTAYGLYVADAAAVKLSDTNIYSGSNTLAPVSVDSGVAAGAVVVASGEIYVPAAFYETNHLWAEGQEKISCVASAVSRYPYATDIKNTADGTSSTNSCYIAGATAPAAVIGMVNYATLYDAIAAAKNMNNATITLLQDVDLREELDGKTPSGAYWFLLNKSMTIDLNGFTIYGPSTLSPFSISSASADVTFKNGTVMNTYTTGNYAFMVTGTLRLDNVNVYSSKGCVNSGSTVTSAKVFINGGTFVSDSLYAVRANDPAPRVVNPEYHVTGGATFISKANYSGVDGRYTAFVIEDAFIYYPVDGDDCIEEAPYTSGTTEITPDAKYQQNGHMADGAYLVETYTAAYEGKTYSVNHYAKGNVAKIGGTEYSTIENALAAAEANAAAQTIVLLTDVSVKSPAALAAGDTLDMAGKNVSFGTSGTLAVSGTITTNGGELTSEGNVQFKSGSSVDGYTFVSDSLLHTGLNLQKVSLSLNEYVDINLKFSETSMAGFNSVAVKAGSAALTKAKTANGYDVYVIEDLKAPDYTTGYWIVAEGASGTASYVGMPKQVSVKSYALSVVNSTAYGYSSTLGMTMTSLLDYAGVDVDAEFPGNVHTDIADYGTIAQTTNGTITAAADITNGYAVKFSVTAAGTLVVKHTDIYGTEFTQSFTVGAGDTVTYVMTHMADAKQTITATLTLADNTTSTLETTLASAAGTADKAIVASNYAESFFTGR